MRVETKTRELFTFDELSDEAKENAINELSGINTGYEWWDSVYEDAENIGIKITEFDLDRNRHAKGKFTLSANEVAQNILNDHGKDCETYKTSESFMEEWQPVFDGYMDANSESYESGESEEKLLELEEEFLKSLLEDYSIMLQKECDYLQSEEAIIGTIQANEYEFTVNGKLA